MADDIGIEKKIVFATAISAEGKPLILLGVPRGAWEHMKDGKCEHFDFTRAGIGVQLVVFGGPDHASVLETVKGLCSLEGQDVVEKMAEDFGIRPPQDKTSS